MTRMRYLDETPTWPPPCRKMFSVGRAPPAEKFRSGEQPLAQLDEEESAVYRRVGRASPTSDNRHSLTFGGGVVECGLGSMANTRCCRDPMNAPSPLRVGH